jgi:acyl carrier protein
MESGAIRIGDNRDLVGRLRDDLAGIVAEILKLDARNVASNRMLLDMGFDSVGLTTFANAINEKYQLDITPVLFFDYPSLGEIARYLTTERKEEIVRCESLVLEGILEKVTL